MGEQTEFDLMNADEDLTEMYEACEAHQGIECEGDCPCRKECCMNEEDEVE